MAKRVLLPEQAYLQERLSYDHETGTLRWRPRPVSNFVSNRMKTAESLARWWNNRYAGVEPGYVTHHNEGSEPYYFRLMSLNKQMYVVSRIIWKWGTGEDVEVVDHKNGNSLDNRWCNLRSCTIIQNAQNHTGRKTPTYANLKGVTWTRNRFRAQIQVSGKLIYLGFYSTAAEAHEAYKKAATLHFGEFARFGR